MKKNLRKNLIQKTVLCLCFGAFLSFVACSKKKISDNPIPPPPPPPPSDVNYTLTGTITCDNTGAPTNFTITSSAVTPFEPDIVEGEYMAVVCAVQTPIAGENFTSSILGVGCADNAGNFYTDASTFITSQNSGFWSYSQTQNPGCTTVGTYSGTYTASSNPLVPAVLDFQQTAYMIVGEDSFISVTPVGVCNITTSGC